MTESIMPQDSKPRNTPKPVSTVPLRVGAIPKELKKLDRWILWKYTQLTRPNGEVKWTKTPHSPSSGHKIDATDFSNGVSFVTAVQALKAKGAAFDGLGFLLGEGIAGIDVDDCIDEDGNLDERGQRISEAYAETYAEVSPSGRGFKILVNIGDDPKLAVIGKTTKEMEIYGGRRYFTVTGAMLPNHRPVVASLPQAFARTAAQMGVDRSRVADMPAARAKDAIGIDMKAARELLDHLPFSWCDLYADWIKAGMALHHEFNAHPDALALWDEWSQRNTAKYDPGVCEAKWQTFGKPGKDEVTLRTLVRDAQATGWRAPKTIEQAVRDFSPFDDVQAADDEARPIDWWQQYSVGSLLSDPAPEKQWVWKGVLRQGKVLVLAGSGGSSKSYLMLGASVQYALGNDWGPFQLAEGHEPGRALLMYGEEDRDDVHDRVQALKHIFLLSDEQAATVAQRLAVLPLRGKHIELAKQEGHNGDVVITEQLQRLEARITQYDIKLVVMDPMAMLHGLDENDNRAISAFISGLDAVCLRTNCSIVLVHHFSKGGPMKAREVNESNVRGASALVAHARTVVVMHRLREDEAQEWGVPEEDHARWVMWSIAKNNYGPSGGRAWFNVNEHNGAITPAPADLQYLNTRDLRAAVQAARDEHAMEEITAAETRRAQEEAVETIQMMARIRILLRHAQADGRLASAARAHDVLLAAGHQCAARRARAAIEKIRLDGLVDTDGMVNAFGQQWLEDREMLE
jgi:RecA-family ATPase